MDLKASCAIMSRNFEVLRNWGKGETLQLASDGNRGASRASELRNAGTQSSSPEPDVEYPLAAVGIPESRGLLDYATLLLANKRFIILMALVFAALALAASFLQRRTYESTIRLDIQEPNENFLNMQQLDPATSINKLRPESYLYTQVKILGSDSLLQRTIAKPELNRRLRWELRGVITRIRAALGMAPSKPLSEEALLKRVNDNLRVRSLGETQIVEATFQSTDAQLAADFVNALAAEFVDRNLELRWKSASRTGQWLSRQLDEQKQKLEKSESDLQAYAKASGLVFVQGEDSIAEEKLKQVQAELSRAQADTVAKRSNMELAGSADSSSLPDVLNSITLREFRLKLTELQRERAELLSTYSPQYYKVQRVDAEINEMRSAYNAERERILNRIKNEYREAKRREALLTHGYKTQAEILTDLDRKKIHYNLLKRDADGNRQIFESTLQRVKEFGIASAMRASNVVVVDPGRRASVPVKPTRVANTALGLLGGLFVASGLVILRDGASRYIERPGHMSALLHVRELGVIPTSLSHGLSGAPQATDEPVRHELGAHSERVDSKPILSVCGWHMDTGVLADSFRALLPSILLCEDQERPRALVVASANPCEGKTTVSVCLGIALAEAKQKVLVVDADSRTRGFSQWFDEGASDNGINELLRGNEPLESIDFEALSTKTDVPGLHILTTGSGYAILEMLYTSRIRELVACIRQQFDVVLIDTPPVLRYPEAVVLARIADALILVVRAGHSNVDAIVQARQRLLRGTRILGAVLNDWKPQSQHTGVYYGQSAPNGNESLAS